MEQLLVPLWLRPAFLQRELLEFPSSVSLQAVGSVGRRPQGREGRGRASRERKPREQRVQGGMWKGEGGLLADISFRRVQRQSLKFIITILFKRMYLCFSFKASNFQWKARFAFIHPFSFFSLFLISSSHLLD